VALDSTGNIYVADTVNCTIRMITPSGITSTLAGLAGASGHMDGTNKFARFKLPEALVVDPTGIIYVADTGNHSIRKIIPSGNNWVVTTIGGNPGFFGSEDGIGTNTLFNSPMGIALDDAGRLYVADTQNNTIRVGQAAPLGSPMLTILRLGNKVVLSWPASASSFNLETSGSLPGSNWVAVTNGIETSGTNLVLTNNIAPTNNFFRLHYP
jgi:secreted PhoX family phosphatase